MNWLDAAIAIGIIIFIVLGLRRGFLAGLLELIGITLSVVIPLFLYIPGSMLLEKLGMSHIFSGAIAFLIIFFISISIFFSLSGKLYGRLPKKIRFSRINKGFGLFTGLFKGIIIITIFLSLLVALPIHLFTSEQIEKSYLGSPLLKSASVISSLAAHIFGEALQNAVGFITIETDTGELIDLKITVSDPVIDEEAEIEMLRLVNQERALQGLSELVIDEALREVARAHSADMFQRGYFGHIDPDGITPFTRMQAGGVLFILAGENLALAPTVSIAHQGLMDSPGHRENILRPQYGRIGIGAVRDNRYGIMFTQNFAN
jgi:uncharacterized protein YkwD